jgi:nitrile hydratase
MSEDHDVHDKGPAARVKALEEMLVRAGLIDPAALDQLEQSFEQRIGPHQGARMVAKSWVDPGYRERLLANASAAAVELGFAVPEGRLTAVENTSSVHNLIVCTLCSCYPWFLLGPPPAWYKSFAYRSRAVRDPRGVLRDFGTVLSEDIEVRVWDSTAEQRYMVIPERPAGTEHLSEEELSALVTRDSMVGVETLGALGKQEESK